MRPKTLAKVESRIRCVLDVEMVVFAEVLECTPSYLLSKGFKDGLNMLSSNEGTYDLEIWGLIWITSSYPV
jgi:hypothetical protein